MAGDMNLDKVRFMEDLQQYDCLYNKFSRDFKDKYKKMNCWAALGEKHNIGPEEAELVFKNIRTAYGRFLKRRNNISSGSGRSNIPVPPEFGNLEWLSVFTEHRKTSDNLPKKFSTIINTSSSQSSSSQSFLDQQDELVDDDGFLHELHPDNGPDVEDDIYHDESAKRKGNEALSEDEIARPLKKCPSRISRKSWANSRVKPQNAINSALVRTATSLSAYLQKKDSKDDNEDEGEESLFCRSLIQRMKQLPKQAKALFRLQVEQLMFQAEMNVQPQNATLCSYPGFNGLPFNPSALQNFVQQVVFSPKFSQLQSSGESFSLATESTSQNGKEQITYAEI